MALRVGAHLQPGVENLFGRRASRLGDGARIVDRVRQRRFAVNVFSRLERFLDDLLVLMRRGGDEDRGDVLVVEHLAVVVVGLGLRREVGCRARMNAGYLSQTALMSPA